MSPPVQRREAAGSLRLEMPVQFLKGVGEQRAALLMRLGVCTAGDLLRHIPRRYEDASTISPIATVSPGTDVTVIGRVISKGVLPTRKGLRIFQAVVRDGSGMIEASWPGQPFLDRSIEKGDVLLLTGPCRFFHGRQLTPREFVNLGAEDEGTAEGRVLAVYPATEGLSVRQIRTLVERHLDALLPLVTEYLPATLLERAGVPPLPQALRQVHRPKTLAEAEAGRSRLAFEELFFVHLLHRRANALARERRAGIVFVPQRTLTSQLRQHLPFTLTGAQTRAVREIVADMCSDRRMHRLLQGDVGSGKTIVALFAALLAMENGYQSAIMAPTELLAEQHAGTLARFLEPLGIAPVLLTGSLPVAERRAAESRVASDEPVLAIGTHALVQQRTSFKRLGFAVIDEQQRFGVEQREALSAKGQGPDVLLMSATPIPRSLALTLYGDLDISMLDERPPGRLPINSALRPESSRERVLTFVDQEVSKGRQAYVVYPVIAESEKTDLKAATTMFETLSSGIFSKRRLALLHGRLPSDERDRVMRAFRDGALDILVATTVIEVGIDVPNATVMLIEHPERFGLSQLHQLRGRVGRGADQAWCILLGDVGEEAGERLAIFAGTEDGFEIARADLRLRGMGDLFGERQHGQRVFQVADPIRDEQLSSVALSMATEMLARDGELTRPEHAGILRVVRERYSRALELFRVG